MPSHERRAYQGPASPSLAPASPASSAPASSAGLAPPSLAPASRVAAVVRARVGVRGEAGVGGRRGAGTWGRGIAGPRACPCTRCRARSCSRRSPFGQGARREAVALVETSVSPGTAKHPKMGLLQSPGVRAGEGAVAGVPGAVRVRMEGAEAVRRRRRTPASSRPVAEHAGLRAHAVAQEEEDAAAGARARGAGVAQGAGVARRAGGGALAGRRVDADRAPRIADAAGALRRRSLQVGRQSSMPSATLAQRTSLRPRHLGVPASEAPASDVPASQPVPRGGPMVQERVQRPGWPEHGRVADAAEGRRSRRRWSRLGAEAARGAAAEDRIVRAGREAGEAGGALRVRRGSGPPMAAPARAPGARRRRRRRSSRPRRRRRPSERRRPRPRWTTPARRRSPPNAPTRAPAGEQGAGRGLGKPHEPPPDHQAKEKRRCAKHRGSARGRPPPHALRARARISGESGSGSSGRPADVSRSRAQISTTRNMRFESDR